jgi:hypothetical protein
LHNPFGLEHGAPTGLYLGVGASALLCAAGDERILIGGGIFGAQRIARQLWRRCLGLFIAASSLFLGQPQVFPEAARNAIVLFIPSVAIVAAMIFWLVRIAIGKFQPKRPEFS